MKVVNVSGIGSGFSHACSRWLDNRTALLNSSWSAVSLSSSNVVCPATSIQVAMFRIDSWLGRRGDYAPSGRLWTKTGRQRV